MTYVLPESDNGLLGALHCMYHKVESNNLCKTALFLLLRDYYFYASQIPVKSERWIFLNKISCNQVCWEVKEDISDYKYSILLDKKIMVFVKKKRLALTGTYVFNIEDAANEIPALAMDYVVSH